MKIRGINRMKKLILIFFVSSQMVAVCQAEVHDSDNMHMLAHWLGGVCRAVVVTESTAYLGSGPSMEVVSFADVAHPVRLGQVLLPDVVQDIDISGELAYVALGQAGMAIIDVSDPGDPEVLGTFDSPGEALGVTVDGTYAYLADSESGLRILNIASWDNPYEVAHVPTQDAQSVALSGGHAFVADGSAGLVVVNIGDPSFPVIAGTLDTPGSAYDVKVDGMFAFVADGSSGLRVIDVSSPSSPVEVGFHDTERYAHEVDLFDFATGSFAAVADERGGLYVFNVSSPSAPSEIRHFETKGWALGVAYSGQNLYVAVERRGVQVFSLGAPFQPAEIGSFDTDGETLDVVVSGNYAYLADGEGCFRVIQIYNPSHPFEMGHLDYTECNAEAIALGWDKVYIDYGGGLRTIDVSNPTNPYWDEWCYICPGYDLEFFGSYLYEAAYHIGLKIIDRDDPTYWVGLIDTPGVAYGVDVQGRQTERFAFVADGSGGLRVIDVTDAGNPFEVSDIATSGNAMAVAVNGNHAYVVGLGFYIEVFNIADPAVPFLEAVRALPEGGATDITISDGFAYVVLPNSGLYIYSLADPTNPYPVSAFETTMRPRRVAVQGDMAYLACREGGLRIIDVGPAGEVGHYQTGGNVSDIAVDWPHVFVADGQYLPGSVLAVDFSQAENPTVDAYCETGNAALGLDIDHSMIYVADGAGLRTVQYVEPHGFFEYGTVEFGYPWDLMESREVVVDGIFAFVSGWGNELHVLFVDDPFRLEDYESIPCYDVGTGGIAVDGSYIYAADGYQGLRKFNKGGTYSEVDGFDSPDYARGVAVVGDLAYLADGPGGLRVIDISSYHPYEVGHCDTPGEAYGVGVSGDFAYVADFDGGVRMIHVADPTNPTEVGFFDTPGQVRALQVNYTTVYAADYYYGVYVLWASTGVVGVPDVPRLSHNDVVAGDGLINVVWELDQAVSVSDFRVNRRKLAEPDFETVPSPDIHQEESQYTFRDMDIKSGESYEYRIDLIWAGNEYILFTTEYTSTPAFHIALYQNQPNPFNPETEIRYQVPSESQVVLEVFDPKGAHVVKLVDELQKAGNQKIAWEGLNDEGNPVGSGVYFYRLRVGNQTLTKKMLLVR